MEQASGQSCGQLTCTTRSLRSVSRVAVFNSAGLPIATLPARSWECDYSTATEANRPRQMRRSHSITALALLCAVLAPPPTHARLVRLELRPPEVVAGGQS